MKQLYLIILLMASIGFAKAQTAEIDLQRDWYANVKTITTSMLDTLYLYSHRDSINWKNDVFQWHHLQGNHYQLFVYKNIPPGTGKTQKDEAWYATSDKRGNMNMYEAEQDLRGKIRRVYGQYKMTFYRDNYNLLYKLMLLRVYE